MTVLVVLEICPVAPGDAQKYVDQITGNVDIIASKHNQPCGMAAVVQTPCTVVPAFVLNPNTAWVIAEDGNRPGTLMVKLAYPYINGLCDLLPAIEPLAAS